MPLVMEVDRAALRTSSRFPGAGSAITYDCQARTSQPCASGLRGDAQESAWGASSRSCIEMPGVARPRRSLDRVPASGVSGFLCPLRHRARFSPLRRRRRWGAPADRRPLPAFPSRFAESRLSAERRPEPRHAEREVEIPMSRRAIGEARADAARGPIGPRHASGGLRLAERDSGEPCRRTPSSAPGPACTRLSRRPSVAVLPDLLRQRAPGTGSPAGVSPSGVLYGLPTSWRRKRPLPIRKRRHGGSGPLAGARAHRTRSERRTPDYEGPRHRLSGAPAWPPPARVATGRGRQMPRQSRYRRPDPAPCVVTTRRGSGRRGPGTPRRVSAPARPTGGRRPRGRS